MMLKVLGLEGIREIICNLLSSVEIGKKKIKKSKMFQLVNLNTNSWVMMIILKVPLLITLV